MSALDRVLERLDGARRSGSGWTARCPSHEDRHASLSVGEGDDGRVLVTCFAGCDAESIVAALGLDLRDLFEPRPDPGDRAGSIASAEQVRAWHEALVGDPRVLARLEELRGWTPEAIERLELGLDGSHVVFPIRDGSRGLVGVQRYYPDPARRNGAPKMRAAAGSRRDLFPAPERVDEAGGYLFLVEGEPDAVAALSVGLAAVSVPGVQGWRQQWAGRFAGRRVCLVFDADGPGREAAGRVAHDLVGVAAEVRVLDLEPDGEEGSDLSDLIRKARTPTARAECRAILERCAEMAPVSGWPENRLPAAAAAEKAHDVRLSDAEGNTPFALTVLTARETCLLPNPPGTDRLLGPLVLRGCRTIIGAGTGEGKTTFAMALLAAVTKRHEFLGWRGAGGRALVLDLEQGLTTVKKRLAEAGLADSDGIDYVRAPDGLSLDKNAEHVAAVEEVLAQRPYAVLLLDPHYKAHTGDSNAERETVDLMRLLDRWRDQYGFALILPAHTRKPPQDASAKLTIHDIFGSSAVVRGAEVVLGLKVATPGYTRLSFFKHRDGAEEDGVHVGGEPWGLLFDRALGYRRDPNDTAPPRDLQQELRDLGADGAWRTLKDWKAPADDGGIGANEREVRQALELLVEGDEFEYAEGPEGRHKTAKCWRRRGATATPRHPEASTASLAEWKAGATPATPVGGGVVVAPVLPLPPRGEGTSEEEAGDAS